MEVLPNGDILPELTNTLLPGEYSKEQPLIAEVCVQFGERPNLYFQSGRSSPAHKKGQMLLGCTRTKEGNVIDLPYII